MIEVKLRKDSIASKTKNSSDGLKDSLRVVLVGRDDENGVNITLTLQVDDDVFPGEYDDLLGAHWYNEVRLRLETGARQSKLTEGSGE